MSLNISGVAPSTSTQHAAPLQHSFSSPSLASIFLEYQSMRAAATFPEQPLSHRQVIPRQGPQTGSLSPRNARLNLSQSHQNDSRRVRKNWQRSQTPAPNQLQGSKAMFNGQVVPPPGFHAQPIPQRNSRPFVAIPNQHIVIQTPSPQVSSPSAVPYSWNQVNIPQRSPVTLSTPPATFPQYYAASANAYSMPQHPRISGVQVTQQGPMRNSSPTTPVNSSGFQLQQATAYRGPAPEYVLHQRPPREWQAPSPSDSSNMGHPGYVSPSMGFRFDSPSQSASTPRSGRESVQELVRTGTPEWDQTVVGVVNALLDED